MLFAQKVGRAHVSDFALISEHQSTLKMLLHFLCLTFTAAYDGETFLSFILV